MAQQGRCWSEIRGNAGLFDRGRALESSIISSQNFRSAFEAWLVDDFDAGSPRLCKPEWAEIFEVSELTDIQLDLQDGFVLHERLDRNDPVVLQLSTE